MEIHAFQKLAQNADVKAEDITFCEPKPQQQPRTIFPDMTPPGMAYVPYQLWDTVYDAETGLQQGTIFPVLDFPFHSEEGACYA